MKKETVASLFRRQVTYNPDSLAIVSPTEKITYSELDYKSSKISAYLQSRNIGRSDLVLVQAERSAELVIALLAIVKCGAAFVPLDRKLPKVRKEYIAEQCSAKLVISTNCEDTKPLFSCDVKTVKELLALSEDLPCLPVKVFPDDSMYVIFTSGTTGNPKGVVIEQHSVADLMLHHNKNLNITNFSRSTLVASVGFDLCQAEIWSALVAGGCIYIVDNETFLSGDSFLRFCAKHEITHAFLPTLKVYDVINSKQPKDLKLEYIYTCGEKLHPIETDHLTYKVIDCYGPTETTIFVTSKIVESKKLMREASIGHPIGSSKIYIMDSTLQELPSGKTGELCIAGSCLARGYLGSPELTADRFVYLDQLNCRIYRSGDQARLLEDGSIQFLGRMDGQVKIRGYRVETGEIEARLLKESDVASAAVVVEACDSVEDKRLIAFVVKRNNQTHSGQLIAKLRRSLDSDLPDYMQPERYYCLDALPSNVNGKTDKQALLEILGSVKPPSLDIERFATEHQRTIANIWFDLLKHGDFGPEDNFFEIGGHSLRAAELANKLSFLLNIQVSVRDIYEHVIFKDLATELSLRKTNSTSGRNTLPDGAFENDVELSQNLDNFAHCDFNQITTPQHILLTGVTGFVGAHLLSEILATSTACIHCLVRCTDAPSGLARIFQIMERYEITISGDDWARIHVYPSDIPEDSMGIEKSDYLSLAKKIDKVYHSASAVNFIMPYSYMKRDNVTGLKKILEFCALEKTKPLFLMSTISIYSWGHRYTGKIRAYETDDIDENLPAIRNDLGYVQSKWVMEKIADLAAARGLPLVTFRLGYATCHSQTGTCANYQWWGRFIQTCMEYDAIPELAAMREGLTTVDFMTKAIAHISRIPEAIGKKFNLCQSEQTNLDLLEFCSRVENYYDRKIPKLPFNEWVALWENNNDSSLYPLLGMFKDKMHEEETILELYQNNYLWDSSNTRVFLEGSGIYEPEFDLDVLDRYLSRLKR